MHADLRWVYRLHSHALQAFANVADVFDARTGLLKAGAALEDMAALQSVRSKRTEADGGDMDAAFSGGAEMPLAHTSCRCAGA